MERPMLPLVALWPYPDAVELTRFVTEMAARLPCGYRVVHSSTTAEALRLLTQERAAVVVTRLGGEGKPHSGLELLAGLRVPGHVSEHAFVIVWSPSGDAEPEVRWRVALAGGNMLTTSQTELGKALRAVAKQLAPAATAPLAGPLPGTCVACTQCPFPVPRDRLLRHCSLFHPGSLPSAAPVLCPLRCGAPGVRPEQLSGHLRAAHPELGQPPPGITRDEVVVACRSSSKLRVLLVHHSSGYYLPSGSVRVGESCATAAARILRDQTGVEAVLHGISRVTRLPGARVGEASGIRVVYGAEASETPPPRTLPTEDSLAALWLPLSQLQQARLPVQIPESLQAAVGHVLQGGSLTPVHFLDEGSQPAQQAPDPPPPPPPVPLVLPVGCVPPEIVVVRHGDRLDWEMQRFHGTHWYQLWHGAIAATLPLTAKTVNLDTCLTNLGVRRALAVGAFLQQRFSKFDVALSSPALRCVQTSQGILQAFPDRLQILLEMGIFENIIWKREWRTLDQLVQMGLDVSPAHTSFCQCNLEHRDHEVELKERTAKLLRVLCERYSGKRVLLVGHGNSHLVVPFCLGVRPQRQVNEVPFCSVTHMHHTADGWKAAVLDQQLAPITNLPVVCVTCGTAGDAEDAPLRLAITLRLHRKVAGVIMVTGSGESAEAFVAALQSSGIPPGEILVARPSRNLVDTAQLVERALRDRGLVNDALQLLLVAGADLLPLVCAIYGSIFPRRHIHSCHPVGEFTPHGAQFGLRQIESSMSKVIGQGSVPAGVQALFADARRVYEAALQHTRSGVPPPDAPERGTPRHTAASASATTPSSIVPGGVPRSPRGTGTMLRSPSVSYSVPPPPPPPYSP